MAKKTKRNYDQAEAQPSRCKKCQSTQRTAYFGSPVARVFDYVQRRPDGTDFTRLIRRRTKCSDCGQYRWDLSYEFNPKDLPVKRAPAKPAFIDSAES